MLFVPYAPPAGRCNSAPQQRQRLHRFALRLFTLTALAGLALKYLPG